MPNNKETIKCGRVVYELKNGDTIMDNGACYQLITRSTNHDWANVSPILSKKAFKEFINNLNVQLVKKHRYHEGVKLYRYFIDNTEVEK